MRRHHFSSPWSRTDRRPLAVVPLLLLAAVSCGPRGDAVRTATPPLPRIEETAHGAVAVRFSFDPPTVRLDRDILMTIRITSPAHLAIKLPPLESRVKGFSVAGSYDSHPLIKDGKRIIERNVRLAPQASEHYRIAPMAVTWREPGRTEEEWFPTKPVVFAVDPLVKEEIGKEVAPARGPVWIYPGLKGILGYLLALLGIAALGYGLWRLLRKVQRAVKLRRMSPRERALFELEELMARDLIGHDRVKDFYFELTMIVRLYIERAHQIRAPEQTTEEFLSIVSQDTRFSQDVKRRLREFLQAADLVKYAGIKPERSTVESSLSTARNYIETDSVPTVPSTPPTP